MPVNLDELFALHDHFPVLFKALARAHNSGFDRISSLFEGICQVKLRARKVKSLRINVWRPTPDLMNQVCPPRKSWEKYIDSIDWRYTVLTSRETSYGEATFEWKGSASLRELMRRNNLRLPFQEPPLPRLSGTKFNKDLCVGDLLINTEQLEGELSPADVLSHLESANHPLWMIFRIIYEDHSARYTDGDDRSEQSFTLDVYPSSRLNLPEGIYSLAL